MGFRGSIAPASLKRGGAVFLRRRSQKFPGLYCPGLIEASLILDGALRSGHVSGALLPRPH